MFKSKHKFATFILTNKRGNNVKTYKTLRKHGYTGKIYLILDDMDETIDIYKGNYPEDEIIVFSKKEALRYTDTMTNQEDFRAVVYARNACFKIAKDIGLDYFLVLDDDYTCFNFRSNDQDHYQYAQIKSLDNMFEIFVDFLHNTPTKSVAFAQGGDFIGGKEGGFGKKIMLNRKCMNSFFCKTAAPFSFPGMINEDVNMYTTLGSRGDLFFTSSMVSLQQTTTQQNEGGLTTIYLDSGTYVKSFYSVMCHPSGTRVYEMSTTNRRLHHRIKKGLTYPKIISEDYKK